jgi:triacylglycerol lipase
MHRGFTTAAQSIYQDVKPRLKTGYTTYLTGHSLGGAVAAILGIYLQDDGVKLGGIYTFGQPKFTNVAGAKAYENLPLLRVIYQNDTVALLPDSDAQGEQAFAHIGPAINILTGPYYVYGSAQQTLQFSQGSFGKLLTQISLPDHKMKWYLQGLREKLEGATQVSFKDRDKYIVRHQYGSGVDTAPVKRQFNFNHHN